MIRFAYSTSQGFSGWYASGKKLRPHRYGKHTAFGERVRWKEFAFRKLGKFATRELAALAGKEWVKQQKLQSEQLHDRGTAWILRPL